MKDLLKGKATNPHLSVSAFFARSLQGLIHHYLSQYKHFRNGNEHKSELNIFRFCCHKLSVQILLFFPQLQSFAQILAFLRSSTGFILENCNLISPLINNIPQSKIRRDLFYSSILNGVIKLQDQH